MLNLNLAGAKTLGPDGLHGDGLSIADGTISSTVAGRRIDLTGYLVLPGIVDMHGDAFERHLAPRRGAMMQMAEGLVAVEAELAANGITTAVLAQFVSWEGGLRGLDFADRVFCALRDTAADLVTDMRGQLRFETHLLDLYSELPKLINDWRLDYVVFNDHLPHARLADGRKPPRLVGQALKAGRNPDVHFEMMRDLHTSSGRVPAALDSLCAILREKDVQMGSHDDQTPDARASWRARGVTISEFPETLAVAEAAVAAGDTVVMGAPNVVRGGSHNGNVRAAELVAAGACHALASDYHYPSPRRAALILAASGAVDFASAWRLISSGPAAALGLTDRGVLAPGKRADIVILDAKTNAVSATIAGGRLSYLSGDIAPRFIR
ncbi:MAG: alpha-D-ribose 1-methylphosphonate 5-triphosphate diphosphatase [Sulfitobacter sp.]